LVLMHTQVCTQFSRFWKPYGHLLQGLQAVLQQNGQNLKARARKISSILSPHWCRSIAQKSPTCKNYSHPFFNWRSHVGKISTF
jgi:hypothetical protein